MVSVYEGRAHALGVVGLESEVWPQLGRGQRQTRGTMGKKESATDVLKG